MRLLIAEDDPALAGFLARGLRGEGDEVELVHDGDAAVAAFLRCAPDLLLLDLDLPGRSGVEVLTAVRAHSLLTPVLVLSGRAEVETRIKCLDLGADDCMMKPFALRELRARCNAMRRRSEAMQAMQPIDEAAPGNELSTQAMGRMVIVQGCLRILRITRQVEINGVPLHLTNREFALLECLVLADGRPVSRPELRERVWQGRPLETNALDVHIGALRRKLGLRPGAPQIETLRGWGFKLAVFDASLQKDASLREIVESRAWSVAGSAWR